VKVAIERNCPHSRLNRIGLFCTRFMIVWTQVLTLTRPLLAILASAQIWLFAAGDTMPASGNHTTVLTVRLITEKPNRQTIEAVRTRLQEFDLDVEASTDRSIEVRGPRAKLEAALGITIADEGHGHSVVEGPDLKLAEPNFPVSAYIPRKPDFF
jgi:hypothetical protein